MPAPDPPWKGTSCRTPRDSRQRDPVTTARRAFTAEDLAMLTVCAGLTPAQRLRIRIRAAAAVRILQMTGTSTLLWLYPAVEAARDRQARLLGCRVMSGMVARASAWRAGRRGW
jgi:hypothetical protein